MEFGEYEFSPQQNRLLRKLMRRMHNVAYFWIAVGGLTLIVGIANIFHNFLVMANLPLDNIDGLLKFVFFFLILPPHLIAIGIFTFKSAYQFRQIVDTQGSDIANLMAALSKLSRVFLLYNYLAILFGVIIWLEVIWG